MHSKDANTIEIASPTSTNRHQLQVTNIIVTHIILTVFVTGTPLKNLHSNPCKWFCKRGLENAYEIC